MGHVVQNLSGTIQFYAWRTASAIVGQLPPRVSYGIAAAAGSIAYYSWPRARRAMLANYARVLPDASVSQRRAIARRSLVNYCKYLADFIRFPSVPKDRVIRAVKGDRQFEKLDEILASGRGVVIVCMHFGNWDVGAGATAARGYPVTVVAETFADERLDAMVSGAREKLGMKLIKMERVGPSLLRVLKRNELLALLIDRPVPGEGVRVRFFGEEVEVPAGPARLALRSGAQVIPTAFPRIHPNKPAVRTRCDFTVPTVSTGDLEADVQQLTQAIVTAHERFIRENPDQWYMFRPMWSTPKCCTEVRS